MIEVNAHRRAEAMQAMREVGFANLVAAMPEPLADPIDGVILANEVADALPVHRLVMRAGELRERWVIRGDDGGFAWDEGDLSPEIAAAGIAEYLQGAGVDLATLPDGSVIEVSLAAAQWMAEIGETLRRGYALIIDYGYPVQELLRDHRLAGTVRGYAHHTVNDDPLQSMGQQDVTAHVDFTWLMQAVVRGGMKVEGLTTQGDFLARIGLGELLVAMQQQEGMTLDVYYRAQAAVYRLIDPGGMGRFRVLGVSKGLDAAPLRGFVETGLAF
jgi:SAM-dependent MidA family methyltransferase